MKPKVFLDMDGLLVNLFDFLAKHFHKKKYKNLSLKEKKVLKLVWTKKERFVKEFGPIDLFFQNLKPFGKQGELTNSIIRAVVDYFGEYNILTHPAAIDPQACIEGKKNWIETYLEVPPVNVYFPQNKSTFAKQNNNANILVDDYLPYIDGWKQKGGVAIQMRTDTFTSCEQIKCFLKEQFEKYC